MFRPNVRCQITPATRTFSAYGEREYGKPFPSMCGVVRLEVGSVKTSVRADASASGGNAEETVTKSRLLFLPSVLIQLGDQVLVNGFKLEVESVYPRHDVNGILDHWQVDLKQWASN